MQSLHTVAQSLVAPGKGILAADESHPTMARRLATIGLESTAQLRLAYRQLLLTAPGLADHVSGVILFDETIRQSDGDGTPFAEVLARAGIVPGIKVDRGTTPLAGSPGEVVTQGLDGLRERLVEYAALGAGPGVPGGRADPGGGDGPARRPQPPCPAAVGAELLVRRRGVPKVLPDDREGGALRPCAHVLGAPRPET